MSDHPQETQTWIDAIATKFDRAWGAGRRPRIEDYLTEVEGPRRPLVLEELLRTELEYRRKAGERPTAVEYRLRFPEDAEVIDLVFPVADHDATVTFTVVGADGRGEPGISPDGLDRLKSLFIPGVVLQGRYTLEKELGHGGMGRVYLGHDRRLGDRPVAIKVILPDNRRGTITEADMRWKFEEEARIGANLVHPTIATVYDYGLHEGVPFTVFEYIQGETLRDLLRRRGRLPLEEVRLIVAPIAQALDFAHSRHVVHRDLKPENIRATAQGPFKILDLGLAKEFRLVVDWAGFCGTPAYASPEQATGSPCDGRADQYTLALIVFEMLTGRRVFEDRDWRALLEKHRSQEPSSDSWSTNRPARSDPRCLVKGPAKGPEPAVRHLRGIRRGPGLPSLERGGDAARVPSRYDGLGGGLWTSTCVSRHVRAGRSGPGLSDPAGDDGTLASRILRVDTRCALECARIEDHVLAS